MKAIIITLIIINLSIYQKANAVCEAYITDEWPDSRYTVTDISGDNVVTDNQTGLMWKQCPQGLTGSICDTGSVTTHTWQQALDLASIEDFAGFTDWRVPNQKELRTIVARNCYSPSINTNIFPNTPSNWFWSSSPFADGPDFAWIVYFGNGDDGGNGRDVGDRVRLVRSLGQ